MFFFCILVGDEIKYHLMFFLRPVSFFFFFFKLTDWCASEKEGRDGEGETEALCCEKGKNSRLRIII